MSSSSKKGRRDSREATGGIAEAGSKRRSTSCSRSKETVVVSSAVVQGKEGTFHEEDVSGDYDEEEDELRIERKVKALQRLVPGGESLEVERLFEETAGYIQALQVKVSAMQALTSLLELIEEEKRAGGR